MLKIIALNRIEAVGEKLYCKIWDKKSPEKKIRA